MGDTAVVVFINCYVVSAPDELKSNPGHLIAIVQHPTKFNKVSLCCIVYFYSTFIITLFIR